ncbi:unnamed protein product [Tilletia controversa]|nr:unnamed protein product [Tilletia controversa]
MASTTAAAAAAAAAGDSGKKRKRAASVLPPPAALRPQTTTTTNDDDDDDDDDDEDENPTSINVDFAFLTPNPEVDSQAIRRLLQQLFYTHAPTLNLHTPTDAILTQAAHLGVGTVVKLDLSPEEHGKEEEEADPYALMTALPAAVLAHSLMPYLNARLGTQSTTAPFVQALEQAHTSNTLLFLLHERMVNLPAQLAPPLYRILFAELAPFLSEAAPAPAQQDTAAATIADAYTSIADAKGKGKGKLQVLFFTRLYSEAAFSDDEDDEQMDDVDGEQDKEGNKKKSKASFAQRRQKRRKAEQASSAAPAAAGGGGGEDSSLHYFHPEDEILIKYATQTHTFRFPAPPSAVSSFETPIFGRLFLLPLSALFDLASTPPTPTADTVTLGPALVELEKVLADSTSI